MIIDRLRVSSERRVSAVVLAGGIGTFALTACSAPPQKIAVEHCSEILKIAEFDRPLAWGERTIEEAAAHQKFRRVLTIQTLETKSNNQPPVEINLVRQPEAVNYDVGGQYCTTTYERPPEAAIQK